MRGKGAPFTSLTPITFSFGRTDDRHNTHHSNNHQKARLKQPITPIIRKIVRCYSHAPLCFHVLFNECFIDSGVVTSDVGLDVYIDVGVDVHHARVEADPVQIGALSPVICAYANHPATHATLSRLFSCFTSRVALSRFN